MAGAMAGSAILEAMAFRETLGSVTLTINNECNLDCPHCYLQYDGAAGLIGARTVEGVLASACERICIVGKEPLANRRSIAAVSSIVERANAMGKAVSLITNGLNAALLPTETVLGLAWIDISLDGGPRTYERYRLGSWSKLTRAVASLRERGATDIRILQTVSARTADAIDDMLEAQAAFQARYTVFSPFQATRSDGTQVAGLISPRAFVDAVAPAALHPEAIVAIDSLYARAFSDAPVALARARDLFGERLIYVDSDPIDRGLVRVTYDDLVLTPFDSVNTADYPSKGRRLGTGDLDAIFRELRNNSAAPLAH